MWLRCASVRMAKADTTDEELHKLSQNETETYHRVISKMFGGKYCRQKATEFLGE